MDFDLLDNFYDRLESQVEQSPFEENRLLDEKEVKKLDRRSENSKRLKEVQNIRRREGVSLKEAWAIYKGPKQNVSQKQIVSQKQNVKQKTSNKKVSKMTKKELQDEIKKLNKILLSIYDCFHR